MSIKGYFAYTSVDAAFRVKVTLDDKGDYYYIQYDDSWPVRREPVRTDLPIGCSWYLELEDGRVLVDRDSFVRQGVLLGTTLESILL